MHGWASQNLPAALHPSTLKHVSYWNFSEIQITARSVVVCSEAKWHFSHFSQWYIVIYKPWKIEGKKAVPKPKIQTQCFWVPMVHIFPVSKLQFSPAASFACGVWKRMKAFFFPWSRSAAWRNGPCGTVACCLRTGLSHLPISPSPSSKPVVVRPLICCNLPLQPLCQDRSYFRSSSRLSSGAKQDFKRTWGQNRKGNKQQIKRLKD